jgi:ABC-type branched-subunit amino acid transport system permease subunit
VLGGALAALSGAILVPVGFEEGTRYIPQFGPPGLVDDLQWVAIGLLIVVFLWFRPQGVLPERRRRIGGQRTARTSRDTERGCGDTGWFRAGARAG